MSTLAVERQSQPSFADFAIELHQRLTDIQDLSGIREILKIYVQYFQAFGAALWEVAEGVGEDRKGRLFIQAQYFEGLDQPPFYHLEMSSISGHCVRENRSALHCRLDGKWDSDIPVTYPDVLDRLGVDSFVSIPVRLKPQCRESADATVTFYRCESEFTPEEFDDLCQAVQFLSSAYRTIHERASLTLLKDVQEVLRSSRFPHGTTPHMGQERDAIGRVLERIASHFQFVEAIIYLHNPSTDVPGCYSRIAEIWPWSKPSLPSHVRDDGGTGWVLATGRPLRLLDMALYSQDRAYYEEAYPGLDWTDRIDIKQEVRRYFRLADDEICPLSYVCVPILRNNAVTGALRCRISRNGPYHVDEDIVAVISAVADMIADWWDHWTREQQENAASQSALAIMSSLGVANRHAIEHLQDPAALEKIMVFLLELCQKSAPGADIVEFWLQEPNGLLVRVEPNVAPVLRQTATLEDPRTLAFRDLDAAPKRNAFRYALSTRSVLHVEEARISAFLPPAGPPVRSFTVAPVMAKETHGVLYFAATQAVSWPSTIAKAASSLAGQLGLYLSFQRQILGLKEVQEKLQESAQEQAQLFLDFQHQLRTPIYVSRNSLDQLLRFEPSSPEWSRGFDALNASTRRASTVTNNLGFFVSLAQGKPVVARRLRVASQAVLTGISQASSFLYNKGALDRRISFDIRYEYTYPLPSFIGDPDLIELAVDNLLDNAVKYSFNGTSILIEAGTALYGREVYFSFRNRGLPITPWDAPRLTQRGFRGNRAKLTSPEGTGVGLWAVAEMMRSMDGRLEVRPTNADGWNEFRIYFRGCMP